jgi:hypothetical protein
VTFPAVLAAPPAPPAPPPEAGRISRQMLRFALGAHLGTALAAAVIAIATGNQAGYYIAGIALLSRDEDLERRIGQMARRIEATLEGLSDHQVLLLAGLRALARMVKSDPA